MTCLAYISSVKAQANLFTLDRQSWRSTAKLNISSTTCLTIPLLLNVTKLPRLMGSIGLVHDGYLSFIFFLSYIPPYSVGFYYANRLMNSISPVFPEPF